MCYVAWPRPNIGAMWDGLDLMCHVAHFNVLPKCHVGWLRPNLCATWHGLSLTYVACLMFCLDITWHGLSLT